MSAQPISALQRLIDRDKRGSPPLPSLSNAPSVGDTNSVVHDNAAPTDAIAAILADLVHKRDFEGLDWKRVPQLERRQLEQTACGGPRSWVYRHGWPVWHTKFKKNYWLCRYCHQHRMPGAAYDVQSSTSSTAAHLQKPVKGHSVGPNGAIHVKSCEGNISGAVARSAVFKMRSKGIEVTQDVANELAGGFSTRQFQEALKDWVAADNQSLRVIETHLPLWFGPVIVCSVSSTLPAATHPG
jgi:hypothetical protein